MGANMLTYAAQRGELSQLPVLDTKMMRQWTGGRSIIGPTLPWTQSTPRWLRGQRCTSRDHEEGP